MCLMINNPIPKIADKDIICYKFVVRTANKYIYKSYCKRFEYVIGQLYTNNISIKDADKIIKHVHALPYLYKYIIREDMFHSYKSISFPVAGLYEDCALLKCIIPEGAYYYLGNFDYTDCYASSQIKILEEI